MSPQDRISDGTSSDAAVGAFTVSDDQLTEQLIQGSMIRDSHYIWVNPDMLVLTEDGPRTAGQTIWYLETGEWVNDLHNLCGDTQCLLPTHMTDDYHAASDAAELQLVEQDHTTKRVSLASLYRKGKARGLLAPRSEYGN